MGGFRRPNTSSKCATNQTSISRPVTGVQKVSFVRKSHPKLKRNIKTAKVLSTVPLNEDFIQKNSPCA